MHRNDAAEGGLATAAPAVAPSRRWRVAATAAGLMLEHVHRTDSPLECYAPSVFAPRLFRHARSVLAAGPTPGRRRTRTRPRVPQPDRPRSMTGRGFRTVTLLTSQITGRRAAMAAAMGEWPSRALKRFRNRPSPTTGHGRGRPRRTGGTTCTTTTPAAMTTGDEEGPP